MDFLYPFLTENNGFVVTVNPTPGEPILNDQLYGDLLNIVGKLNNFTTV